MYIALSQSVPCYMSPCLTLSQFAANASLLKSNILLFFLSGNHTLGLMVSVSGISNLTMLQTQPLKDLRLTSSVRIIQVSILTYLTIKVLKN